MVGSVLGAVGSIFGGGGGSSQPVSGGASASAPITINNGSSGGIGGLGGAIGALAAGQAPLPAQGIYQQPQMTSQDQLFGMGQTNIGQMAQPTQQTAGQLNTGAQQVLNTSMDPQQALYDRLFQQNTDQTRAGLAARGLNMSGVGQGIENQSNQNFNMDWQNQQLARQAQGLNAAGQAANVSQGLSLNPQQQQIGNALNYLQQGANTQLQAYPYAQLQSFGKQAGVNNLINQLMSSGANMFGGGNSGSNPLGGAFNPNIAAGSQPFQNLVGFGATPFGSNFGGNTPGFGGGASAFNVSGGITNPFAGSSTPNFSLSGLSDPTGGSAFGGTTSSGIDWTNVFGSAGF